MDSPGTLCWSTCHKGLSNKKFLIHTEKNKTKQKNNFLNEKTFHDRLKEQLILHPHPTRIKKFLTKKVLPINPQKTFFQTKKLFTSTCQNQFPT